MTIVIKSRRLTPLGGAKIGKNLYKGNRCHFQSTTALEGVKTVPCRLEFERIEMRGMHAI
jgi:hypothetical protein